MSKTDSVHDQKNISDKRLFIIIKNPEYSDFDPLWHKKRDTILKRMDIFNIHQHIQFL